MILTSEPPVCSRCATASPRVVAFLAVSSNYKRIGPRRGASRMVRLCGKCVRSLAAEFNGSRPTRRRRR